MNAQYNERTISELECLLLLQYERVEKSIGHLLVAPSCFEGEGLLKLLIKVAALRSFIGGGCHQSVDRVSASVRLMLATSISQQKVFALARQYCRESDSELVRARYRLQGIIKHYYLRLDRRKGLSERGLGQRLEKLWRVFNFYLKSLSKQQCNEQKELKIIVIAFEALFAGDVQGRALSICFEKRVEHWVSKKVLPLKLERKEIRTLAVFGFFMCFGAKTMALINDMLGVCSSNQYYRSKDEIEFREKRSSKALGLLLLVSGEHKGAVLSQYVEQRVDVDLIDVDLLGAVSELGKKELLLDIETLLAWQLSLSRGESSVESESVTKGKRGTKTKFVRSAEVSDDIVYAAYRLQQSLHNKVVASEGLRLFTEILFFYRQKQLKLSASHYSRIHHFVGIIKTQLLGAVRACESNEQLVLSAHLDLIFLRTENYRLNQGLVTSTEGIYKSVQRVEHNSSQSLKVAKFLSTQLNGLINLSSEPNASSESVGGMQSTLVKELRALHHGAAILSVSEIERLCSLLLSAHEAWLFFPGIFSREDRLKELSTAHFQLVAMLNQAAAWRDVATPNKLIMALQARQNALDEVLSSKPLGKGSSFAQHMSAYVRQLCWLLKCRVHLECRAPLLSFSSGGKFSKVILDSTKAMIRFILLEQIEAVEERRKYGKPEHAALVLSGAIKNRQLKLSLSDDARGRPLSTEVLRRLGSQLGHEVRHVRFSPQGNTYQWLLECNNSLGE